MLTNYGRGQCEPEAAALTQAALRPDVPPLHLYIVFGNSQSYAATFTAVPCTRFVGPVEACKDVRQVLRRDALARVGHAKDDFKRVTLLRREPNLVPLWSVTQGVRYQIAENLTCALFVSQNSYLSGREL